MENEDTPWALIGADNKAINFITWNGVNEFDYGQANGNYLVPLLEGMRYNFGWEWNGTEFIDPNPEPVANTEPTAP